MAIPRAVVAAVDLGVVFLSFTDGGLTPREVAQVDPILCPGHPLASSPVNLVFSIALRVLVYVVPCRGLFSCRWFQSHVIDRLNLTGLTAGTNRARPARSFQRKNSFYM
jgi:hypothetical protein